MKLKTLKDLEGDFIQDYDEDGETGYVLYNNPSPILRQEAIKRAKHNIEKLEQYGIIISAFREGTPIFHFKTIEYDVNNDKAIYLITGKLIELIEFYNLAGEELK